MKIRKPDSIALYGDGSSEKSTGLSVQLNEARAWTELDKTLRLFVAADETPLRFVRMRWIFTEAEKRRERVSVLGDVWERSYGDLTWENIKPERCMPWVCIVSNGDDANRDFTGRFTECFGVKTRASALCFWQYDEYGLTLWADIRNGGSGVILGGRTLMACETVFYEERDSSAFGTAQRFYRTLNDIVLVPDHRVYGSNNWYYAYGVSSHDEIMKDSELVSDLCAGIVNRPYMVIDDGWQKNSCDAPWDRGNERFPDMAGLARSMKNAGVRPGIWIRYLSDIGRERDDVLPEYRLSRDAKYLDPSHPGVLELVRKDTRRIVNEWGFNLIKHDYTTYDIFGAWGNAMPKTMTKDGWSFYDRSKTSAEIVVNLYKTIREAAGEDTVIIGCNTIGHLAAGLVHLNRTGDDISGRHWEMTRFNGVNTLAFRMLHHRAFYAADADCVGIMGRYPFRPLNSSWLNALASSGTPLFVSCKPGILEKDELDELKSCFARASRQEDELEPIDWMQRSCPERWLLNGEECSFKWLSDEGADSFRP